MQHIEQLRALIETQNSERVFSDCIERAINHPQIFVFGEFLAMP